MAFEEILTLMPPFARFLYYLGAAGFLALTGAATLALLRVLDPMPKDWWNEDGD